MVACAVVQHLDGGGPGGREGVAGGDTGDPQMPSARRLQPSAHVGAGGETLKVALGETVEPSLWVWAWRQQVAQREPQGRWHSQGALRTDSKRQWPAGPRAREGEAPSGRCSQTGWRGSGAGLTAPRVSLGEQVPWQGGVGPGLRGRQEVVMPEAGAPPISFGGEERACHWRWIDTGHLCVCVSVRVSICHLSMYPSVYPSVCHLCIYIYLCVYPRVYLPILYPRVCLYTPLEVGVCYGPYVHAPTHTYGLERENLSLDISW